MHIDNPDALKTWLTKILEPLCEADPAALARYVLALLKKDKAVDELSQCMAGQLDVFLGHETKPFLDRLFVAIESQEYVRDHQALDSSQLAAQLLSESSSAATVEPNHSGYAPTNSAGRDSSALPATSDVREATPPVAIASHSDVLIEHASPIVSPVVSPISKSQLLSASGASASELHLLSPASKAAAESHGREMRRRRTSNRSRTRSRSRSFERKVGDREKQYRNKSPPTAISGKGSTDRRPYDRRGDRRGNGGGANSWKSRSRSPERRKIHRSQSPSDDCAEPKAKRQRCRDFEEKGYCMRGETCPWDHGIDPVVLEDINNPALISIQSGSAHGRGAEYSPDAPEIWTRGGGANFGGRGNNSGSHRGGPGSTYPRSSGASVGGGGAGGVGNGANFRGGPPGQFPFPGNAAATTPLQRELISVPVLDGNQGGDVSAPGHQKRRYEPEDTVAVAEGPTKRKPPINSRLGPRVGGGGGNGNGANSQQNCSLELRKVPRGMNSITHLNNHFSKFGKIINIQVSYDGDAEAAIVTFSTHAEANVAYRSTEAVLNNRFIKVFWHSGQTNTDNHAKDQENGPAHVRHKGGNQYSLNNTTHNHVHTNNGHSAVGVSAIPTAAAAQDVHRDAAAAAAVSGATPAASDAAQAAANLRARNNRVNRAASEIIRKKQEEKVKAAAELAVGLRERKTKLLNEYLKQLRSAIELVDRTDNTNGHRSKLLTTIKNLNVKVEDLQKELRSDAALQTSQQQLVVAQHVQPAAAAAAIPIVRKTVEEQKKELLDIELELIGQNKQASANLGIRQRIEELQRNLGISKQASTGHFGVARNPRVRPAPPGSTSVDRRPTTLLVSGFEAEDSDALLGHFKHFGEVTKNELDSSVPSIVISFATRINAEQAMLRGRTFKDVPLQISWVSTPPAAITQHSKDQLKLTAVAPQPKKSLQQELDDELELELDDDDIISGTGAEDSLSHHSSGGGGIDGATQLSDDSTATTTTIPNNNNNNNAEQLLLDEEDDEEEEEDADESEDRSWRR